MHSMQAMASVGICHGYVCVQFVSVSESVSVIKGNIHPGRITYIFKFGLT